MEQRKEDKKARAVILAAGRGKRMGSLTGQWPKCFTEVKHTSLIRWVTEALRGAGIVDIALVRGYRSEAFTDTSLTYFDNVHWETTNMVASLLAADTWLSEGPCVITYSDIAYPIETVTKLLHATGEIIIPYNTAWLDLWNKRFANPLSDAETFKVDERGVLLEIGKRADSIADIEGQYMGLIKCTPEGWEKIKSFIHTSDAGEMSTLDMTSLLQRVLYAGVRIDTFPVNGAWLEMDSESDLALYEDLAQSSTYLDWLADG